jgi:3-oxoadipate enol-lactonase
MIPDEFLRIDGGFIVKPKQFMGDNFALSLLRTADGIPLPVYDSCRKDTPCVVVIPAISNPCATMAPLIRRLIGRFRVVTWDSRGYPSVNDAFDHTDLSTKAHLGDLGAVLASRNIEKAHMIGYCTGSILALRAAAEKPGLAGKLVSVCGCFNIENMPAGHSTMKRDMELAAFASRDRAAAWSLQQQMSGDWAAEAVNSEFAGMDPESLHYYGYPRRQPEFTYRFLKMFTAFRGDDTTSFLPDIAAEVLVIGVRDDRQIPFSCAEYAHAHLPRSRLKIYEEGGHFALLKPNSMAEDIAAFLEE